MTKKEFIQFISEQQSKGSLRFSLGFNAKGEIILYWTKETGLRDWRVLTGNRGKKPTQANRKRMSNFRRWLVDARKGMGGGEPDTE